MTKSVKRGKEAIKPPETTERSAEEIRFYRANEKPYGVFSNLFRRPIIFEGIEYATAEHAYQAGKARKPKVREWLLNAPSRAPAHVAR